MLPENPIHKRIDFDNHELNSEVASFLYFNSPFQKSSKTRFLNKYIIIGLFKHIHTLKSDLNLQKIKKIKTESKKLGLVVESSKIGLVVESIDFAWSLDQAKSTWSP